MFRSTVVLASTTSRKHYPDPLRRIHYHDAAQDRSLRFLTHNFDLPALTIVCFTGSAGRWNPSAPESVRAGVRSDCFSHCPAVPEAETIHLVMDNLNIHRRESLTDFYGVEVGGEIWDRYTVHYTPTHGSWLNQAEIEIGLFSRQCLGSRRIPGLRTLRRELAAWNRQINRAKTKINWGFKSNAACRKLGY